MGPLPSGITQSLLYALAKQAGPSVIAVLPANWSIIVRKEVA